MRQTTAQRWAAVLMLVGAVAIPPVGFGLTPAVADVAPDPAVKELTEAPVDQTWGTCYIYQYNSVYWKGGSTKSGCFRIYQSIERSAPGRGWSWSWLNVRPA